MYVSKQNTKVPIEKSKMSNYEDAVKELERELKIVFDEEQTPYIEPYGKKGALTYLLSLANTLGLKEKTSADAEVQQQITAKLRELDIKTSKAIFLLESYMENPPQNPSAKQTGAKPKSKAQSEPTASAPNAPNINESNPFLDQSNDDSNLSATNVENQNELENKIYSSIWSKIRGEFSEILKAHVTEMRSSSFNQSEDVVGARLIRPVASEEERNLIRSLERQEEKMPSAPITRAGGLALPISQMKFDKVTLMDFDGNRIHWIQFKNQIMDYVYNNPNLTATMKFHQLQSHLKGLALEAAIGLHGSQGDFDAAWECLLERYDNEYRLVNAYLGEFYALPYLKQYPTSEQFYQMVNKTKTILRVMPSYKYDVKSWDPILMFHLTSRFDTYTLRKWNDQVKKRQRIALTELIEFIEIQGAERSTTTHQESTKSTKESNKAQPTKAKPNQKAVLLTTNDKPKCIHCSADHIVFTCKKFKEDINVDDRIKKCKAEKVCLKCLVKHGKDQPCKLGPCKTCGQDHNHLLCHKREQQRNAKMAENSQQTE